MWMLVAVYLDTYRLLPVHLITRYTYTYWFPSLPTDYLSECVNALSRLRLRREGRVENSTAGKYRQIYTKRHHDNTQTPVLPDSRAVFTILVLSGGSWFPLPLSMPIWRMFQLYIVITILMYLYNYHVLPSRTTI